MKRVRGNTQLEFDYITFVVIASVIAAGGLAVNSTVSVVASMLVSPIMGPVLAVTFGTMIRTQDNATLMIQGMWVEAISLLICMLVGFIVSLCFIGLDVTEFYEWPTGEMTGRGQPKVMYEGLLIAVPSGVGVSIGLLDSDMCPLVGVAISASLLPPAVNTGMLLAYSWLGKFDVDKYGKEDLWQMAGISLSLTLENIV